MLLAPKPVEPPLVAVDAGRVLAIGDQARQLGLPVVHVPGTLAPALIDLQVNGGAGVDLQRPDPDRARLHAWLREGGVLTYQPTLVSAPLPRLRQLAAGLAGELDGVLALRPHLEGPFIADARLGAHDREAVRSCDPAELVAVATEHAGMVTLAPERPGGMALVESLTSAGVRVSLGHSDCTAEQAQAAFAAGAGMVTHLFNAMAPLHHRAPGLAGAALAAAGGSVPWVGLIADGVHVDPLMCLLAARLLGERLVLVSDAAPAAGTGAGESRTLDGRLAGSTLRLDACVANLVRWGVEPWRAVHAATAAPAAAAGLADRGSLAPGSRALGVLFDGAWSVVAAGDLAALAAAAAAPAAPR